MINDDLDEKISGDENDEVNELAAINVEMDEHLSQGINIENIGEGKKCCGYTTSWLEPAVLKQIQCVLCASLAGVLMGYTLVYPGLFLAQWDSPESDVHLSLKEASLFASASQFVGIPASLICGFLQEITGPKRMMMISLPFLGITFGLTQFCAQWGWLLIILRIFQGILVPFIGTGQYVYTCETLDVKRRNLSGLAGTSWILGVLLAYVMIELTAWHQIGYIMIILTSVTYLGLYYCPESPLWLIKKNRLVEAKDVFKIIRVNSDLDFKAITANTTDLMKMNSICKTLSLLKQPRYSIPIIISFFLHCMKELSGNIAMTSFGIQILRESYLLISPSRCMIILTGYRVLCIFPCMAIMFYIPRRVGLAILSGIAVITMLLNGLYFSLSSINIVPVTNWVPILCMIIYVTSHALGLQPITDILSVEILPLAVRNIGFGIGSSIGYNLGNFLVIGSFLPIQHYLGLQYCFYFYSLGALGLLLIAIFFIPETKGKYLHEIEGHWVSMEQNCYSKKH